jgi:hypothetical protein
MPATGTQPACCGLQGTALTVCRSLTESHEHQTDQNGGVAMAKKPAKSKKPQPKKPQKPQQKKPKKPKKGK